MRGTVISVLLDAYSDMHALLPRMAIEDLRSRSHDKFRGAPKNGGGGYYVL